MQEITGYMEGIRVGTFQTLLNLKNILDKSDWNKREFKILINACLKNTELFIQNGDTVELRYTKWDKKHKEIDGEIFIR